MMHKYTKMYTFCAVCIKQMFQIQCGGLNYGLRSHLPLIEGLTYLYHLYISTCEIMHQFKDCCLMINDCIP